MGPEVGVSGRSGEAKEDPARVLLVGYNGANNTGSESRLLSIIEDVRAVLGPEAVITIHTLNAANLRRYIEETPTLRIEAMLSSSTLRTSARMSGVREPSVGRTSAVATNG